MKWIRVAKNIYGILYWNFVAKKTPTRLSLSKAGEELNIILNGPSSKKYLQYLANESGIDKNVQYMVVNQFAIKWRELFYKLAPQYYVAIDPFFSTCSEWIEILEAVDWEMSLIVNPLSFHEFKNPNIHLYFLAPIEIVETNRILYILHMNNWCNLSLSNVACAAITVGIRKKFERIYLYGLDYDYCLNISVDINNHLQIQNVRHSYDGEEAEDLHDYYPKIVDMWKDIICNFNSFYIMEEYARKRGVQIINRNPNSLIDAFVKEESDCEKL